MGKIWFAGTRKFCMSFQTGMTFSRYLTDRRVAAAKRILSTNKADSIIEISAQAGFKSVSSFNRIFKQKTGQTPSEYRDAHKET